MAWEKAQQHAAHVAALSSAAINMSPSRNQGIMESAEAYFSFQSSCVCLRLTILLPLAHWSITSLSLPCPSHRSSGHSGTHDPVCGKRWERSGSTKGLAAINFAQATFTIIQRDSRLIALTLSPRRACLPVPAFSFLGEYQGAVSLRLR